MLEWEWWEDHNVTRLFITLLLSANHEDKKWRGVTVKRGQLITSLANLSKITGLSVKSVRFSLNKLKSTNEVASKGASHYTIITICNYAIYQQNDEQQGQAEGQAEGQTRGKQRASQGQARGNKQELKNVRIKENIYNIIPPDFEIVKKRIEERKVTSFTAEAFFAHYTANGWKVGKNKMKNWDAALTYWINNQKKQSNGFDKQNNSRNIKRVNQLWN